MVVPRHLTVVLSSIPTDHLLVEQHFAVRLAGGQALELRGLRLFGDILGLLQHLFLSEQVLNFEVAQGPPP